MKKQKLDIDKIEKLLGYVWRDRALLEQALTHPSAAKPDYQRFEFLGDRVLGLAMAEILLETYPLASEGELGRRHAALVREETLAAVARSWNLGDYVRLGSGERQSGGADKSAILADTVEAILGAMYLDGGWKAAHALIRKDWKDMVRLLEGRDAKTRLQEVLQAKRLALPQYIVLNETGPDHDKSFRVRVACGLGSADGEGRSKRSAEMAAVTALLDSIELGVPGDLAETRPIAACCGLVALVGAPNVGKSTLLNKLVGEKVGIVSPKANTTRMVVRGIVNHDMAQLVLVDTPGLNESKKSFDRMLVQQARGALLEADVVMLVVDAARGFDDRAREVIAQCKESGTQIVLVLNKVDLVQPRSKLLGLMTEAQGIGIFKAVFAVDSQRGRGTDDIPAGIAKLLPEHPWLFPEEMKTDVPLPLRLAEVTREKAMRFLQQELPYGVGVLPGDMGVDDDGQMVIRQDVLVAHDRHKGMVIGNKGAMLQRIGSAAREDMEEILGQKVYLDLLVKVEPGWQERQALLQELGILQGA